MAPKQVRAVTIDATPADCIPWDELRWLKGTSTKHVLPDSIKELVAMVRSGEPLQEESKSNVFIKVAPHPFSDAGACR
jgi:hypothetical protein